MHSYNRVSRIIHWLSAITILGLFALGWWMVDLGYYHQWYQTAPHIHKSIGVILALVTLFRIIWKKLKGTPKLEGSALEVKAAKSAHHLMYLLLLTLFISGYLISTEDGRAISVFDFVNVPAMGKLFEGQADLAGEVHYYVAYALIGLVFIHALAALKHHFIDKDNTLRKMTGGLK
ncbi:cytochrome b [Vibrio ezurae]|uniref:Putative cytochrome b561 n=1 Tax=Vibrio ezurae NBRC 102218 TaxID=1219080 RepID=U3CFP1_9VIBR|nr:cytochrome b [Vibrio ezurae]GAD80049.1 putative cytochrome b561 [Vibrio ezurae NBRC 102218]